MKLSTALAHYLEHAALHLAASSVAGYGYDLRQLVTCATSDRVTAFDGDLLRRYVAAQTKAGRSRRTLLRKLVACQNFSLWGLRHGYWPTNPVEAMDRPRRVESVPKPFADDERDRLMRLPLPPEEELLRAVLYYTGLRATPICTLTLGALSFASYTVAGMAFPGSLRSVGKGGKTQITPMHPELKRILWPAVKERTGGPAARLFVRRGGHAVRRRHLEVATAKWGALAKVPQCIPHRFRHQFATDLLRLGVKIEVIKELLGHANIATTLGYTKVADGQTGEAILRLPSFAPTG